MRSAAAGAAPIATVATAAIAAPMPARCQRRCRSARRGGVWTVIASVAMELEFGSPDSRRWVWYPAVVMGAETYRHLIATWRRGDICPTPVRHRSVTSGRRRCAVRRWSAGAQIATRLPVMTAGGPHGAEGDG